jgi:hypothetical protein
VELTPDLRQACDELGEVKHIVSPNYEHVSFGKQVGGATELPALHHPRCWHVGHEVHVGANRIGFSAPAVEGRLPQCNPLCLSWVTGEGA